ncbi:MAG: porin [Nitrospirae bacterium]|nr:porin [Nitrospirota bacterium]
MRKLSKSLLGLVTGGVVLLGLGVGSVAAGPTIDVGDAGSLKIDYQVQFVGSMRDTGSGPDGTGDTTDFYFRRNRLSFLGKMNDDIGYAVQFESAGGNRTYPTTVNATATSESVSIIDAYITYKAADALQFRVGQIKHNLSREILEHCFIPLSADRSLFGNGSFSGKATRDYGVVMWGNIADGMLQYRLGAMDGNEKDAAKREDGLRYSGRVHLSLLDPENGYGYQGTYMGEQKVLTVGASYEQEKNAIYNSTSGAVDYKAYSYDVFFEYPSAAGTVTLAGSYLKSDMKGAGLNGFADAEGINGEKNGTFWKAGYMVGKVQFFGRAEEWTFAKLDEVKNQQVRWTAGGLNYYIKGQDLKLTLEYSKTDFDTESASVQDFNTMSLMVQARF